MYPCLVHVHVDRVADLPQVARALDRVRLVRALFRLGSRIEINSAMIPITTSSSTSVNPPGQRRAAANGERAVTGRALVRS
jgi:hypothetical protein